MKEKSHRTTAGAMEAVSRRIHTPWRGGSMATECIAQVAFQGQGFAKPLVARFDVPDASTDGGLILLKALDSQLGLTERLAALSRRRARPGQGRARDDRAAAATDLQ